MCWGEHGKGMYVRKGVCDLALSCDSEVGELRVDDAYINRLTVVCYVQTFSVSYITIFNY